ncbi:MAG: hypothetical protein HZA88_05515 [Verrucomicrobia bacterium]|nr:hypothetical protein [Verrucomicrobiota bacterium]
MKRLGILFVLVILTATGCRPSPKTSAGDRDYLLGWYELPRRHYSTREVIPGFGTLIPVLKKGGSYYSVSHGVEVPLKACPEGLEWGLGQSSMRGTKIGVDAASKAPYISIEDQNAQYEGGYSTFGEKQFMTRIDRPSGLLDPTTSPPQTIDDFLGCYQPLWLPVLRWELIRDGNKYHVKTQILNKDGWKTEESASVALEPLPKQLGFVCSSKKKAKLIFNRDLKRFECVMGPDDNHNLTMPLVRIMPSLVSGTGATSPPKEIGIPTWH